MVGWGRFIMLGPCKQFGQHIPDILQGCSWNQPCQTILSTPSTFPWFYFHIIAVRSGNRTWEGNWHAYVAWGGDIIEDGGRKWKCHTPHGHARLPPHYSDWSWYTDVSQKRYHSIGSARFVFETQYSFIPWSHLFYYMSNTKQYGISFVGTMMFSKTPPLAKYITLVHEGSQYN